MIESIKRAWTWIRENWFYTMILAVFCNGCTTLSPATKGKITDAVTYAAAKMDCEKQGKDYKCETPRTNCQCVERVVAVPTVNIAVPVTSATTPAPAPVSPLPPTSPTFPLPQPSPVATPVSPVSPPTMTVGRILQPGETIDIPTQGNSLTFKARGIHQTQANPNKDHIWWGILWTVGGREINCHIDSTDDHLFRLTCQNFTGSRYEEQDRNDFPFDPNEMYTFTFAWLDGGAVRLMALDSKGAQVAEWNNSVNQSVGVPDWARIGDPFNYPLAYPIEVEVTLP